MADLQQRDEAPLLALEEITVRVRSLLLFPRTDWTIGRGEQWAILGPNGCGKSSLVRTIAGELPSAAGRVRLGAGERVSLVSFEAQARLYAHEIELDHARHFSGRTDELLTTRGFVQGGIREGVDLEDHEEVTALLDSLELTHLLDRPFRHLSAGEMRKALIARALASQPSLLILDEPFDALDMSSRQILTAFLERLIAEGRHLILVTHRADEILPGITHVLMLKEGQIVARGPRDEVLEPHRLEALYGEPPTAAAGNSASSPQATNPGAATAGAAMPEAAAPGAAAEAPETGRAGAADSPLVELRSVTVRYGETTIFRDLSWRLKAGERWGLFGPNGSGKTTIINLIVGDNLQAYAQGVYLFGQRRGSGESIWEIRQRIGIVTPHLQLGYRHSIEGLEVVLSGFFDSIGLYRRPTGREVATATWWMERFGIGELAERHFGRLSYGQRRLLLIARAMVKSPRLLILDEPCQGLDPSNRRRVLEAIDTACASPATDLIYVSHHADEYPSCLTHALRLSPDHEPEVLSGTMIGGARAGFGFSL